MAPRDDSGSTDFSKRRDRAINEVTNALAQAAEHIEKFFTMLQNELAFYVGCLNLSDTLRTLDMPICIPSLIPQEEKNRSWNTLYDISLALTKNEAVVGNDFSAENKELYIITGANQGGKTTFLRSLGQVQIMAQCGMFVGAGEFLCADQERRIYAFVVYGEPMQTAFGEDLYQKIFVHGELKP
ncbi:MAG: hypothetical protein N2171_07345 [Clostridia bacterium]|nr:hypothetical protein [Clostridia bacterium]